MSQPEFEVTRKTVADQLIACVRFRGRPEEIGDHFRTLVSAVEPHIEGKGFTLYHGGSAETGFDIEVCFPVSHPVQGGRVTCRTLEGGEMLCAIHRGPYRSDEKERTIGATWGKLWRHVAEHEIGATEGPYREIYLEDDIDHGDDTEKYVTELQIPLMLPVWLGRFAEGLDRHAGERVRRDVMAGSDALEPGMDAVRRIRWIKGAMERLDAAVVDEDTRARIMHGCAHRFPQPTIDRIRTEYERLGTLAALLDFMDADSEWRGARFERDPDGNPTLLYVEKIPANRKAHESATN